MTKNLLSPKGEIIIHNARPEDAEAILALRLEALTNHPEAFAADAAMTQARGAQAWQDLITRDEQDESGVVVIAGVGEKLVGMAGIGRGHWPKTRHSAVVWGVYVNPQWRGLHIAEAMLDECVNWARQHEVNVLKLGVITTNQAAIRCYQRAGFTVYGTEPETLCVNGTYYDECLMARPV